MQNFNPKYSDKEDRADINNRMFSHMHPGKVVGMGAPIYNHFRMETENALRNGKLAALPGEAKRRLVKEPMQPRMFLTTPQKPMGMHTEEDKIFSTNFQYGSSSRGEKGRVYYTDRHHENVFDNLTMMPQHHFTQNHVSGFQEAVSQDMSRQTAGTRVNTKSAESQLRY